MNLQDFLNYKTHCPLCQDSLKIGFCSKQKQVHPYQDTYFFVDIPLKAIKRGQKNYTARLVIDSTTNQFWVEFGEKKHGDPAMEYVPSFVLNKFKEYMDNIINMTFYVYCENCNDYAYHSGYFNLDFQDALLGNLEVKVENFNGLVIKDTLVVNLFNNYIDDKSSSLFISNIADKDQLGWSVISLPLLNFTTKEEIIKRINKLLPFS